MPCGHRKPRKLWEAPRHLRRIAVSKYEQNEPSVKLHWKNVVKDLEEHYKDDKFWESQSEVVRELVGAGIYKRIQKIFQLPLDTNLYEPPPSPEPSVIPSEQFYVKKEPSNVMQAASGPLSLDGTRGPSSISDPYWESIEDLDEKELHEKAMAEETEESEEKWTVTSSAHSDKNTVVSKTYLAFSKKSILKSQKSFSRSLMMSEHSDADEVCSSNDDMIVHLEKDRFQRRRRKRRALNPHFQLLFCNESETDMIKWKSHYKKKTFDLSASDEFSKKAELITKKICKSFFDWWTGIGVYEFKSEIKRPEDIEALFQVWFDEHASRGLVLNPKILPCVLQTIADATNAPETSCRYMLKEEIASDIYAETTPAHTQAFGVCLPHKMKHIPPQNNTLEMWKPYPIPEDLRSMACVWGDIKHLTSTKAFSAWLKENPLLTMPPCLMQQESKALFTQPSDFYLERGQSRSVQDLALPVSQVSVEMKAKLSQLMK